MLELSENDWFQKFETGSIPFLHKLKAGDSEVFITGGVECSTFGEAESSFKVIRSEDFNYSYKIKNGIIVGLSVRNESVTKNNLIKKLGEAESKTPVLGEIVTIDCFLVECYEWEYPNLRVILDKEQETILSFHFGEKIQYFDQ